MGPIHPIFTQKSSEWGVRDPHSCLLCANPSPKKDPEDPRMLILIRIWAEFTDTRGSLTQILQFQ